MHFKAGRAIKDHLVKSKDRDTIWQKSWVIYRYKCGRMDCEEECTKDSGRTFAERYKEHMKAPSPIYDHHNITGYNISIDNFSTIGSKDQHLARSMKEAIFIRVSDPFLNRNIGKCQLPHIWEEALVNSTELKFM